MKRDNYFMRKAFKLAAKSPQFYATWPLVGCIIVKNNKIVGQGYYKINGGLHAEAMALKQAGNKAKYATMYVTLEPHCYFSRTPACTNAIINAKIKQVFIASCDPNPKVNGKGIAQLRTAKIKVTVLNDFNLLAKQLNELYFKYYLNQRPVVAVKFAVSLDGKLATYLGDSKWITNDELRKYTRALRGYYPAILVGVNTVIKDNPHLGARNKKLVDPWRIILDPNWQIPLTAKVLRNNRAIIVAGAPINKDKLKYFNKRRIKVLMFNTKKIPLKKLLSSLNKLNIKSLLVEGGGDTVGNFIDEKLVDKVYACYAPILVGGKDAVSIGGRGVKYIFQSIKLKNIIYKKFGDNFLVEGDV